MKDTLQFVGLIFLSFYLAAWLWVLGHRLAHEFCGLFLFGCPS